MISLGDKLFDSMKRHSTMCALKIEGRHISYEELNNKALAVAGSLSSHGMINRNIGIVTQRNFSAYAGILGAIYAGCAYVPINPKYPKKRIAEIIGQAGIVVLVGDESDWKDMGEKIQGIDCVKYVLFPEAKTVYLEKPLIVISENHLNNNAISPCSLKTQTDNIVYLMFTSGSTGRPKGVQVTGMNVLALLNNMKQLFALSPGFKASQTFDLSFDLSVSDTFFTWLNGGTLCVLSENELSCPAEYIAREKIDFWHSVPTLAEFLKKLGYLQPGMYESLKYSLFCGEPLAQKTADAWIQAAPNSTVENFYGPTETTVFVSRYNYTETESVKLFHNDIVPIGKPFADHQMVLLDEEENMVGNKEVGEIAISGAQVSKGYLNDSEKTKSVFVSLPWDSSESIWYKTGDLGRLNQEGNLEFVGRKDNQIKIAGRRVEIGEIEAILRGKIRGTDAVVIPIRDESKIVKSLVAFVTVKLNENDIKIIRDNCVTIIESLFFPSKFIYINQIPTTVSGKIDRKHLEQLAIQK